MIRLFSAVIVPLVMVYSPNVQGQQVPPDVLERVQKLYGYPDWDTSEERSGIPLGDLKLEGWVGRQLRSDSGHLRRRFDRADNAAILIEAFVGKTALKGREHLLLWLAMRPSRNLAEKVENDLDIGDVAFADPAGVIPKSEETTKEPVPLRKRPLGSISFVRGNVAVRINNIDPRSHPKLDLVAIAKRVDEQIQASKVVREGDMPPLPEIIELSAKRQEVPAGEAIPLTVVIEDPTGGSPHLEWRVGGPGQGYVEQGEDGIVRLHTTKHGPIKLHLEVTGSTGTFKSSSLKLNVLPRRLED